MPDLSKTSVRRLWALAALCASQRERTDAERELIRRGLLAPKDDRHDALPAHYKGQA